MGKATRSSSRDGAKVRWKRWEVRIPGIEFVELDIENPKSRNK
jgi:hypothetical protein